MFLKIFLYFICFKIVKLNIVLFKVIRNYFLKLDGDNLRNIILFLINIIEELWFVLIYYVDWD